MANDNTLIYRAQSGDEGAFVDLIRVYYPFVYAIVIRIVNNPHDAEEIVQDTFLNAYRGLAQYQEMEKFKNWLGEIARNRARSWLRKQRIDTVPIDEVSEHTLGTQDLPDEQLIRREQRELIRRAMGTLSEKDREIARAYYLEGASLRRVDQYAWAIIQRHCISAFACEAPTLQTVAIPSDWHLRFPRDDAEKILLRKFSSHESRNGV